MSIHSSRFIRRLGTTLIAGLFASTAFPQGSLTPPAGPPGPTQKTLQQIWDKIDALETQSRSLQDQVGTLQNDNAALSVMLDTAGVAIPWRTAVATNTLVQVVLGATNQLYHADSLSLAISPNGAPALSWSEGEVYAYATMQGSRWKSSKWPSFEGTSPDPFQLRSGALGFLPSGQAVAVGTVATAIVARAMSGVATNLFHFPLHEAFPQTPQLVISAEGRPEISYHHVTAVTNVLRMIQWTGGSYTNALVATNNTVAVASTAVSPTRETGISYVEKGTFDLRYAYRVGNVFTNGLVSTEAIYTHSFAFAVTNVPTVCYWSSDDGMSFDLKLAARTGSGGGLGTGSWDIETIEPSALVGEHMSVSLAFAPSGQPCIAYSASGLGLRYATKSATGAWSITQVAPPAPTNGRGFDSVLRFTRSGYPVIAYWDPRTDTIRVATRAPFVAP